MAEGGQFSIEIPVTADLTQFRQQLRAELAEASRGVSVPIRAVGGTAGGGAMPSTVASAEEAAVSQAFASAQATTNVSAQSILAGGGGALTEAAARTQAPQQAQTRSRAYNSIRSILGLLSASDLLGTVADLPGIDATRLRGESGQLQADRRFIDRVGSGFYGGIALGGLTATDYLSRQAGFSGLGRYSPIAFQEASERAEQSLDAVQQSLSTVRERRDARTSIDRSNRVSDASSIQGSVARAIEASDETLRRSVEDRDNALQTAREQLQVESDPQRRASFEQRINSLNRLYPDQQRASINTAKAEQREILRQAGRRYVSAARALRGLSARAEARFGEGDERDFAASLAQDESDAFEESGERGKLQTQINTGRRAARVAEQASARQSIDEDTTANFFRLQRRPEIISSLTKLADQQRVALENAKSPADEKSIRGNFTVRAALELQQFNDQRFETGQALDSANRQSRDRQRGGAGRIDAQLDEIVTATARDARAFEREGDPDNAVKRRTLGVNQIREARSNFFRSINFEEVSGDRIAGGTGDPFAGIDKKFKDAEGGIGKSKEGSVGQSDQARSNELLQQILDQLRIGITGVAG